MTDENKEDPQWHPIVTRAALLLPMRRQFAIMLANSNSLDRSAPEQVSLQYRVPALAKPCSDSYVD
jgi:hypothetical protein